MRTKKFLFLLVPVIVFFYNVNSVRSEGAPAFLDKYNNNQFKVVIVPGHDSDPASGGTEFKGLTEADLNLKVGEELFKLLSNDEHFQTFITRDASGYKDPFVSYFTENRNQIISFFKTAIEKTSAAVEQGTIKAYTPGIEHKYAALEASIKLYGLNKWANENNVDLTVHIHFNDYPDRPFGRAGRYSGSVIFIPEHQMANYNSTLGIARSIFGQLEKYFPVSNNPIEKNGLAEDHELIALGENGTLNANTASLLIEYGYIYEPQWADGNTRALASKELAYQTYAGLKKYFEPANDNFLKDNPQPQYIWRKGLKRGDKHDPDILALQIALSRDGLYPPANKTKNDCPISGIFGPCTETAVMYFQRKYNIPATGYVGPITLSKINKLYSN